MTLPNYKLVAHDIINAFDHGDDVRALELAGELFERLGAERNPLSMSPGKMALYLVMLLERDRS